MPALSTYIAIFKTKKNDADRTHMHLHGCVETVVRDRMRRHARDAEVSGGRKGAAAKSLDFALDDGAEEIVAFALKQVNDRDEVIQALAAQLKAAGLLPDVGSGAAGKMKGKGKGDRKIECFTCGGNHYARDCPKKPDDDGVRAPPRSGASSIASSDAGGSLTDGGSRICHFHKPLRKSPDGSANPRSCNKGDKCEYTHSDTAPSPKPKAKAKAGGVAFARSMLGMAAFASSLGQFDYFSIASA